MTITQSIVIDNQYIEQVDLPGEIYDEQSFKIETIDEEQFSNAQILKSLVAGTQEPRWDFWAIAQVKYNFLSSCFDEESIKLWKLICDQAYLTELLNLLKNKPTGEHWVDIYRKSYQRLERMVTTYTTNPIYKNLNTIFDVSGTAQHVANELLLEQTQPASEARIHLYVDGYTNDVEKMHAKPMRTHNFSAMRKRMLKAINFFNDEDNEITGDHLARFRELLQLELDNGGSPFDVAGIITETPVRLSINDQVDNLVDQFYDWIENGDHYIKVPDLVLLPDHNGVITEVPLVNLQDNLAGWSGDLTDTDHDWYEEGHQTSSSILQMEEQELKITSEYYQLRSKYKHILAEIERRIKTDVLVRYANADNREFAIESAENSVARSTLVQAFIKSLKMDLRSGIPVQDIAAIVMELPFEITVNGNIDTVIDQFGDDILDSIVDPAGMNDQDEHLWEQSIDTVHQSNISELERVANNFAPKHSAVFTTQAFKAVAEDHRPITEAISQGYDEFRSLSPSGLSAYRQALSEGLTPSQAMTAFYKEASRTGEYTPRDRFKNVNKNGVLILTASSGYTETRELSWALAKYKAGTGELYVPKSAPKTSKRALYDLLCSKNWGTNLIAKLSE
jgi:hypothetical protein